MALVVLAENISTSGIYEIRVDVQYLLTSIAQGANGDMWLRFFRRVR